MSEQGNLLNLLTNPKFKICYEHKDGYFLIPQLFDNKEVTFEWPNAEQTRFKVAYEFMPKGIISQLIVALNVYIHNDIFWKYGVLLKYKADTYAFVMEERVESENAIYVTLRGSQKRELMAIIGKELDEINRSFTNLVFQNEFACNCAECYVNPKPHFYSEETVNKFISKSKPLKCPESTDDVPVERLLGDYITKSELESTLKTGQIVFLGNNNRVGSIEIVENNSNIEGEGNTIVQVNKVQTIGINKSHNTENHQNQNHK